MTNGEVLGLFIINRDGHQGDPGDSTSSPAEGPARPHGRHDFEAADGDTRLTFSLDAQLTGLRRLLMGGAVLRMMESEGCPGG
jgi:hypothetical protein